MWDCCAAHHVSTPVYAVKHNQSSITSQALLLCTPSSRTGAEACPSVQQYGLIAYHSCPNKRGTRERTAVTGQPRSGVGTCEHMKHVADSPGSVETPTLVQMLCCGGSSMTSDLAALLSPLSWPPQTWHRHGTGSLSHSAMSTHQAEHGRTPACWLWHSCCSLTLELKYWKMLVSRVMAAPTPVTTHVALFYSVNSSGSFSHKLRNVVWLSPLLVAE